MNKDQKKPEKIPLLAVIGHPIFFSRSPELYHTAFKMLGVRAHYLRLASATLPAALQTIQELAISAFHVTSPFKEEILRFLDEVHPIALSIGAVNLVIRARERFFGYNTDPGGLDLALKRAGIELGSQRVLVLGAGGASRATLFALKEAGLASVWVANRSEAKGRRLARQFGFFFLARRDLKKTLASVDLIISCLPKKELLLPSGPMGSRAKVIEAAYSYYIDRIYRNNKKRVAARSKRMAASGLDWLLGQGLASLRLLNWRRKELSPREVGFLRRALSRRRAQKKNIALVGFMGCGKSSLGRLLARDLGRPFLETDEAIERHAGLSIEKIFADRGEKGFRELEASLLPALLKEANSAVISLGGGAVKIEEVRNALRKFSHVVWLWTPVDETWARIAGTSRPLLARYPSRRKLQALLEERIPSYARSCDLLVRNDQGRLEETMRLVKNEVGPFFGN